VEQKPLTDVNCPRAKTWMTPCVARDGSSAVADDGVCVGCGADPEELLHELATRYPKAGSYTPSGKREAAAALKLYVRDYVEAKGDG
jgi:hypothetical protein